MQFFIVFSLFCFLVLEQTSEVTSMASIIQTSDYGVHPMRAPRRLRAPLMGRSTAAVLDNDVNILRSDSNDSGSSNENEVIGLKKRRFSFAVLGGRKWMNSKRRGPLFG